MHIDVIIPTYNRSSVLKNAIDSVLGQSYTHFNLYIVDDGSSDETDLLLNQYKDHSQVTILKQKNQGVSAARNLGIRNSKASWLCFLDSDDTWLPDKLKCQVDFLMKNSHLRFIHTEEIWVRNGVRVNPKIKHQKSHENLFLRSLDFCLISPSTVMIRRDLLNEHGLFNEDFVVCEDYDLWLKVLAREEVGFLPMPLTIKNGGHEDQLSTKFVAMDYWRIKSLLQLLKSTSHKEDVKEEIKKVLIKKSQILMKGYLKHDNLKSYQEIKAALEEAGLGN